MTRRRWIADEFTANCAVLTGSHADHLVRVLRAQVGQEFDIVAGANVREGRITAIGDHRVEFALGKVLPTTKIPEITLLLAIFKFDRMEWAIEKCTELGAAKIVPVIAHRTESHLASAAQKRRERWERIAHQAAEQSRRTSPPEISQPMKLKDAVIQPGDFRILLNESEKKRSLKQALESHPPASDVLLAVGPEGGWTEAELASFIEAGWASASLGGTILRTETAAIAALAVAAMELSQKR